jgi:DNA-binding MarR family transcriptional regulator
MSVSERHLAAPPRAPDSPGTRAALETREFFISRVSTLNVLLKRRAAIYARRQFGFTLVEWRIITLLPTLQPVSIRELAVPALVDAAQASRAVARLAAKGYVLRERGRRDSREVLITLTKPGMQLSVEMCRASLERNDQLLAGRSPGRIEALNAEMDELIARARALLDADAAGCAADAGAAPRVGRRGRRRS